MTRQLLSHPIISSDDRNQTCAQSQRCVERKEEVDLDICPLYFGLFVAVAHDFIDGISRTSPGPEGSGLESSGSGPFFLVLLDPCCLNLV